MKRQQLIVFFLVFLITQNIQLFAQSKGNIFNQFDEQGLEAPKEMQLSQDREAFEHAGSGWWKKSQENRNERMAWFNDAKFGCFIHWGAYSDYGGEWKGEKYGGYAEHLMRVAKIPVSEYKDVVVRNFNPSEFDAEEWMLYAKNAGMKYFVVTAKHHDGFAMYFSEVYPYDMSMAKLKIDPMMALREAARKHDIKFGFYYSHAFDWEHPDAPGNDWDYPKNPGGDNLYGGRDWWLQRPDFLSKVENYVTEKSIPQIQELIIKYDPDILWFDTPHKFPFFENMRILEAIRKVDPENKIVVNGRLAHVGKYNFGDYCNTGDRASFFPQNNGYWESIPTTNESYGYSKIDREHKSIPYFVRLLASATAKGGNILMNVGPMGNGKWDDVDVEIFEGIGNWLNVNGESIYGAQKTDLPIQPWGVLTRKADVLYIHVYSWPKDKKLIIGGLTSEFGKAWIVSDSNKKKIEVKRINNKDVCLTLPSLPTDTINTVFALQIKKDRPADTFRLLDSRADNTLLTFDAKLIGEGLGYGDGKAGRNYITGWNNNHQYMTWNLRVSELVQYEIYLDHNTQSKEDSGTVELEINGKIFNVDYTSFQNYGSLNRIFIGTIQLKEGEYSCSLKGKVFKGQQYMRPIALYLKPLIK